MELSGEYRIRQILKEVHEFARVADRLVDVVKNHGARVVVRDAYAATSLEESADPPTTTGGEPKSTDIGQRLSVQIQLDSSLTGAEAARVLEAISQALKETGSQGKISRIERG